MKPKKYLRKAAELLDIPDEQMKIVIELLKDCEQETAEQIFEDIDEDKMLRNYTGETTEFVRIGIRLVKAKIQKFIKEE